MWELWNGDTADPAMNSGNHVMLVGDLNIWMHEYLAGIQADPQKPGFKHIVMHPRAVGDLSACKARYESIHGTIVSDWKIINGQFCWEIQIPVNTTATISIPASEVDFVQENKKPAKEAQGVKFVRMEKGLAIFELMSGHYYFESH